MKYSYRGSDKDSHREIAAIGRKCGLQHSWREPIGIAIARLANLGKPRFVEICESNPKFFERIK